MNGCPPEQIGTCKGCSNTECLEDLIKRKICLTCGREAKLMQDLKDAAGELLVSIPEPGTEKAKLLIANRLMISKVDQLQGRITQFKELIRDALPYVEYFADVGIYGKGSWYDKADILAPAMKAVFKKK